jgi:hypothetical protein
VEAVSSSWPGDSQKYFLIKTLESPNNYELLWFAEKYSAVCLGVFFDVFHVICESRSQLHNHRNCSLEVCWFFVSQTEEDGKYFCPTGASKIMQSPSWTTHVD